nr:YbaN family protein [Eubacterium oxidoreducens]
MIARPRAFGQKKEAEEEKKKSPKNKRKKSRSKVVRALWAALGCVCLTLGTVGVVLPILPTVPFYLVTIFCFAKSSDRLYQWFTDTKLYHKHLENFVKHRAMTVKTKAAIMISVTAVMAFGFIMMHSVPIGRIILACVWVMHLIIFLFVIKTISREEEERLKKIDGKNDIGESVNYD